MGRSPEDVGVHWCCAPASQWDAGALGHPGLLLRARRLIERVAGLEVDKASVTACVGVPAERPGERQRVTRRFRTTTAGLVLVRDWLASHAVTVVGRSRPRGRPTRRPTATTNPWPTATRKGACNTTLAGCV
jgi:hypothetical protein